MGTHIASNGYAAWVPDGSPLDGVNEQTGGKGQGAAVTDPSAAPDPNQMDGQPSGGGGDVFGGNQNSNPYGYNMPQLGDANLGKGQGMFTSSSGGMGTFGGFGDTSGGGGSTGWNSGSDLPTGTYQNGYTPGAGGYAGGGVGTASGGGYGGYGGGSWAAGGGLQQYPDSSNTYGQSTMGVGAGSSGAASGKPGSQGTGGNQPLGSTIQGTPNVSVTGGGFDPASPRNPFNQAQPWNGGPMTMMSQTGFNPGGTGPMPQTAYNRYQGMLTDPTSMTANPAYKAIMDAALQATQRAQLAHGGNGGGTMAAELAKTGASVAGQYLPQMAQMYQGGAQQEAGNWGLQNQANLGYGNLGNNMWTNAANNQFNIANAYGQMQNGAANTQGAALAQAQMNPANNYFQNQLTLGGWG